MKDKQFIGYRPGSGIMYQLSAVSKLLFFLLVSISAMATYDTRMIVAIALFSLLLFRLSHIRIKDIAFVLIFTLIFASLNASLVYLFSS